jgi:hypothetical protein
MVYSVHDFDNPIQLTTVETSFASTPSRIMKSGRFRVLMMSINDSIALESEDCPFSMIFKSNAGTD